MREISLYSEAQKGTLVSLRGIDGDQLSILRGSLFPRLVEKVQVDYLDLVLSLVLHHSP